MIDVENYKDGLYWTNELHFYNSQGDEFPAFLDRTLTNVTIIDETANSEFTLGNVIGKRAKLRISNHLTDGPDPYRPFDDYNFLNGYVDIYCNASYEDTSVTTEPRPMIDLSVSKGRFNIINATTQYDVIELDAVDSASDLDIPYVTNVEYPASLKSIFNDAILVANVATEIEDFPNSNYVISSKPENCTFRNIFGWIAMMAGCNVRFSPEAFLEFISYDTSDIPSSQALSGYNLTSTTNPITVTGVKVINSDNMLVTKGSTSSTAYYLVCKDNPFIDGHEEEFATFLLNKFNGFTFKNFEGDFPNDLRLESHDAIKIKDLKGNIYQTVITSVEYNTQGATRLKCQIDNPTINNSDYKTVVDREIQVARDKMKEYSNNYILFSNTSQVTATDGGAIVDIAEQEFAVVKPAPAIVFMEFLVNVDTTQTSNEEYDIYNNANIVVNYYYDDMNIPIADWKPKDSLDDGEHWLELYYLIGVEDLARHKFKVGIQSTGGSVTIPKYKGKCVLMGQGLVGNIWDGTIHAQDEFNIFDFKSIFRSFTDSANAFAQTPLQGIGSDNFNVINFGAMLRTFTDSVSEVHDIVAMYYGDGISDDSNCPNHPNNTWTGAGYIIGPAVSVIDHVTVNGSDSGIEFLVSYDNGATWVGLQNGEWVENASMTKVQLEAITQEQWYGYPLKIKATLGSGAFISSLVMHDARISS